MWREQNLKLKDMPAFTFLMILILIGSVSFFLLTLSRVIIYDRKYRFQELSYTKLFKVITKSHILVIHSIFTLTHLIFTIWLIWTL